MHSPLDAHLHTAECNEIIKKLVECHKVNGKWKQWALGTCEDLDTQMRRCTKEERLRNIKENQKLANERTEKLKERSKKQAAENKTWRDSLNEK